jgi:hypothetical protein
LWDGSWLIVISLSFWYNFQGKPDTQTYNSDADDSDKEAKDTRKLLTQHNRKKKKSGGFQSMGKIFRYLMHTGLSELNFFVYIKSCQYLMFYTIKMFWTRSQD